ncbi:hypothetical protein ALO56_200101 [Pseudomonas viridiflava]|nr:hypothetical protein ALO56_200101 [Pseudomonas viridiflava]
MLRLERPQTYRQLMAAVLVQAGFLTHTVKPLAQAVTLGLEHFALLGVQRHGVERVLQFQT